VETRTIERIVPADPASPSSVEQKIMEAGQVWYPNSAFKTGQAIFDFNREELPLIIFANWRGFSGGQQDMFDEVLKRGSLIVDGLSSYKAPVFVYIVPNGELRGGAWVVVDPSINQNGMMEMYADKTSRAGVLEPEGIVEIKLRKDKITALMTRLDETYRTLKAASSDKTKSAEEVANATNELAKREKFLWPTYSQLALQFADLHDRANRMKAKGTIRDALDWSESRRFFYWRLKRRLQEERAVQSLSKADSTLSRETCLEIIEKAISDIDDEADSSDDRSYAEALERDPSYISTAVTQAKARTLAASIAKMAGEDKAALVSALKDVFGDRLSSELGF